MEKEGEAFYVVRKGNIIAIYKSLSDCQAQVGSSVCDPAVSVYKGYSLPKEAEEYLASRGLKNASYAISEMDVKEDLFGTCVPCPFQEAYGSTATSSEVSKQHSDIGYSVGAQPASHRVPECLKVEELRMSCILEFDGASKGNPGKAGAGAILRDKDGNVICRLRQGLGFVTNNVAEYRGLILGMIFALKKGFNHIRVYGDSQLVCMQVQGLWQTKNPNMIILCKEAMELKNRFLSFQISHIRRDLNSEADVQANHAINLKVGEIYEEHGEAY